MIEAFWKLLDEMPNSDITLMALIRRAGVNHNTFYYHFKNMASLAEAALENNLVEELPNLIISGSFGREQTHTALEDFELRRRIHRISLLAGPHAPAWLRDRLKSETLKLWLRSVSIDSIDSLPKSEQMQLSFTINGLLGLRGDFSREDDTSDYQEFMDSGLGRAAVDTMKAIAASSCQTSHEPADGLGFRR